MKKIFITGGCGYVGSMLVPMLLNKGYYVTVLDILIYGNNIKQNNDNLKVIKGDIRDVDLVKKCIVNHDTCLHLACISNDPSFELNPQLGKLINFDSFEPLVKFLKIVGLKNLFMLLLLQFME